MVAWQKLSLWLFHLYQAQKHKISLPPGPVFQGGIPYVDSVSLGRIMGECWAWTCPPTCFGVGCQRMPSQGMSTAWIRKRRPAGEDLPVGFIRLWPWGSTGASYTSLPGLVGMGHKRAVAWDKCCYQGRGKVQRLFLPALVPTRKDSEQMMPTSTSILGESFNRPLPVWQTL